MTDAVPVHCPLHKIFVTDVVAVRAAGWVTVEDETTVHPFESVTVTVYVPAHKLPMVLVHMEAQVVQIYV